MLKVYHNFDFDGYYIFMVHPNKVYNSYYIDAQTGRGPYTSYIEYNDDLPMPTWIEGVLC